MQNVILSVGNEASNEVRRVRFSGGGWGDGTRESSNSADRTERDSVTIEGRRQGNVAPAGGIPKASLSEGRERDIVPQADGLRVRAGSGCEPVRAAHLSIIDLVFAVGLIFDVFRSYWVISGMTEPPASAGAGGSRPFRGRNRIRVKPQAQRRQRLVFFRTGRRGTPAFAGGPGQALRAFTVDPRF